MKTIIFILGFFLLTTTLSAQDEDFLLISLDTITGECGYVDSKGQFIIPIRKYPICLTDTFKTFAVVYKSNRGFVGINRKEEVLFQLMQHGREPDFPQEGLFRIVIDNKIGFANLDGKIVIPAVYDMVLPFNEGMAAFCEGCGTDRSGASAQWSNGTWGFIDKTGEVAIKAQFQAVKVGFKEDKARVKLNNKWIEIDKTGNPIVEK
jgi:hypothetical protein